MNAATAGGPIQVAVPRRERQLFSDRKFKIGRVVDTESVIKREIGGASGGESCPIVVD